MSFPRILFSTFSICIAIAAFALWWTETKNGWDTTPPGRDLDHVCRISKYLHLSWDLEPECKCLHIRLRNTSNKDHAFATGLKQYPWADIVITNEDETIFKDERWLRFLSIAQPDISQRLEIEPSGWVDWEIMFDGLVGPDERSFEEIYWDGELSIRYFLMPPVDAE